MAKTYKEIMNEAKKYPSQDEADALADWSNKMADVYVGGAPDVRKQFDKADKLRMGMFDKVFGDKSPWRTTRTNKGIKAEWDDIKAKGLGL